MATVVGYAGGTTDKATYGRINDHTETVMVFFDPAVVSYEKLLEIFWSSHNPRYESGPRQYRNVIIAMTPEQEEEAKKSAALVSREIGGEVMTPIEKAGPFHPAEDYHQKYYLRNTVELYREMKARYPTEADFVASTAATRINGLLGARGTKVSAAELESLGLSERGKSILSSYIR